MAIIVMQKRILRYVCCVPALISTNSLFVKTGILKLNEIYNLRVCKMMLNTLRGFEVDHSCFNPVSMVHSQNTRYLKNNNFIDLGLNSFRYLGPSYGQMFKKI